MSNTTPETKLIARWTRSASPTDRWQTLQSQLSQVTASVASHWTRRSFVTCKWRALPAGVSAPASNGMA
jgi:hypothetical protein